MISVLSEEFRLNQKPNNATWIVEEWTYSIDGNDIAVVSNNFHNEFGFKGAANKTLSAFEKVDYRSATLVNLTYTGTAIPLRSILFLLCDLLIRFFFPLPNHNRIAPTLLQGYKWQTRRDASTGAVITLEILDTSLPNKYEGPPIKIDNLFRGLFYSLMIEWMGDYDDEEALQQSFEARFYIKEIGKDFAKLTLEIPDGQRGGMEDIDENIWIGHSWLANSLNIENQGILE